MSFKFSNYYAELGDGFYTAVEPNPLPEPKGVIFNRVALMEAGFGDLSDEELTAFFSGNTYPKGAKPLAMKYAGHQFGHYNPDLGDGRGLLMGQINNQDGELI
ncbi:MAG: protein adenylyltransferase SelO family protein, partial [Emcibacteraceae bacterium]|nr:protein adenylyltransferase SelO family protein [Emcibacteraceae bacterium]